jgi:hypothetical protein
VSLRVVQLTDSTRRCAVCALAQAVLGVTLPPERGSGRKPSLDAILQELLLPAKDRAPDDTESATINVKMVKAWLTPEPEEIAAQHSNRVIEKYALPLSSHALGEYKSTSRRLLSARRHVESVYEDATSS